MTTDRAAGSLFNREDVFCRYALLGATDPVPKRPLLNPDERGQPVLRTGDGDGLEEGVSVDHGEHDTDLSVDINRKIEGDERLAEDYRARMELGRKIKEAREAIGMSQAELARRVGMKQQSIGSIEMGQVLRPKKLPEIARVLRKPLDHFISDNPQAQRADAVSLIVKPGVAIIPLTIAGVTAAGVWMEAEAWDADRFEPIAFVPTRHRGLEHTAWAVSGASMDQLGITDGSFVVTVPYWDVRTRPQHGDVVVVERRRGGTIERTCKEVQITDAGVVLAPRSSDPRFKPLVMPDGDHEADGTEIEIVGLVVSSQRNF